MNKETLERLGCRDLTRAGGGAQIFQTLTWCKTVCVPCPLDTVLDTLCRSDIVCQTNDSECNVCVIK